jgi:hypothetical protein
MFSFRYVSRQMINNGHPIITVCYVAFNHCRTLARADPQTQPVIYSRFVKQPSKSVQPVCNSVEESNCEVANRGSCSGNSDTSPKANAEVRLTHTFADRIGFFRACKL